VPIARMPIQSRSRGASSGAAPAGGGAAARTGASSAAAAGPARSGRGRRAVMFRPGSSPIRHRLRADRTGCGMRQLVPLRRRDFESAAHKRNDGAYRSRSDRRAAVAYRR